MKVCSKDIGSEHDCYYFCKCNCQFITFLSLIDEEGGEEDDTPKPDWKPPPVIPKEDNRTGTNKRTFFVTTERRCHIQLSWFSVQN